MIGTESTDDRRDGAVPGRAGVNRRRFLKYALVGGTAAAAAGVGAGLLTGALRFGTPRTRPLWERDDGTVDYGLVPERIENPTLRVAQWYDYWPGSALLRFQDLVRERYGVSIEIVQDIYTSDEEIFNWISILGNEYDLIFPADFNAERMIRAGLLYNMNPAWLTNYGNLWAWLRDPATNPYAYPARGGLYAVPYQWGTTGIGFRTDKAWTRDDVRAAGWEVFWMDSLSGQSIGRRTMILDEPREAFGATWKRLGWNEQIGLGLTPTNITHNPSPPYSGEFQWSENETSPEKIAAAKGALVEAKQHIIGFNTVNQGPYLVNGIVDLDMAWSGDIMYAIRPHTSTPQPVDYVIPEQGGTYWVTNAAIPRACRNLWLTHLFIDFLLDPAVGAAITDWNLYATPNEESFDLLTTYPQYGWDPREDERIYADMALGYSGPSILQRCEQQHDLGADVSQAYLDAWAEVKFG